MDQRPLIRRPHRWFGEPEMAFQGFFGTLCGPCGWTQDEPPLRQAFRQPRL